MSLKPGIGASWYKLFGKTDVHRQDFVIADGSRFAGAALLRQVDAANW